ncbi:hypothetical protein HDU91_005620 [Kappamyces sp. JEL0680]|nr:hypothetical protein HDU91_005620 [Kappamyces sp. JEL0680]
MAKMKPVAARIKPRPSIHKTPSKSAPSAMSRKTCGECGKSKEPLTRCAKCSVSSSSSSGLWKCKSCAKKSKSKVAPIASSPNSTYVTLSGRISGKHAPKSPDESYFQAISPLSSAPDQMGEPAVRLEKRPRLESPRMSSPEPRFSPEAADVVPWAYKAKGTSSRPASKVITSPPRAFLNDLVEDVKSLSKELVRGRGGRFAKSRSQSPAVLSAPVSRPASVPTSRASSPISRPKPFSGAAASGKLAPKKHFNIFDEVLVEGKRVKKTKTSSSTAARSSLSNPTSTSSSPKKQPTAKSVSPGAKRPSAEQPISKPASPKKPKGKQPAAQTLMPPPSRQSPKKPGRPPAASKSASAAKTDKRTLGLSQKTKQMSTVHKKVKKTIQTTLSFAKVPMPVPATPLVPRATSRPGSASSSVMDFDENGEPLYFGGKLNAEQADTSKCVPGKSDRDWFLAATKQVMEEEKIGGKGAAAAAKGNSSPGTDLDSFLLPRIPKLQLGEWEIDTWYAAPYPEECTRLPKLYLCEFCLKYLKSAWSLERHMAKCSRTHPPGDEIYRDGSISIFEVDGRKNKIYCQNLCLIAKTFLDHKTLYYDVEPFLFYIMCERNEYGCHLVGYFSKVRAALVIGYLLSRVEGTPGTPEKPLSDLGLLSYRYYWRTTIIKALLNHGKPSVCINDLIRATGMTDVDVSRTLSDLNALYKDDDDVYNIRFDPKVYKTEMKRLDAKGYRQVNPSCLQWSPKFLFFKNFRQGPAAMGGANLPDSSAGSEMDF